MDPGMIDRLRRGQAEEKDHRLATLLVERGVLTADEAHELRGVSDPGAFGEMLVRSGRITTDHRARLEQEAGLREILDTIGSSSVPMEVAAAADDTRMHVSKFVRMQLLGQGGMGEVWKAWDTQLNRWVALKFLKGDDPEEVKRFLREANLASQLAHSSIPRVFEVGVHPHRPYIAIELIDGRSLEGVRLDRWVAAAVARDAARAVHYAHEQGIIHRDLKPANIMQSKEGKVFVTDFGLARAISSGATVTQSGALLGTPSYMAPEQATGSGATPLSDVYGLGATLFALVEGVPPYDGDDAYSVLIKVLKAARPQLRVKDDLAVIVSKAMERDPRDRYASAKDLADDLDRYIKGEPTAARPLGTLPLLWRRSRRHPVIAALVILAILGLGVAGNLGGRAWVAARQRERDAVEAGLRARKADQELGAIMRLVPTIEQMRNAADPNSAMLDQALEDMHKHVYEVLALTPENANANFYCGLMYYYRRDFAKAESHFTETLEKDPNHHEARRYRGMARILNLNGVPYDFRFDENGFKMVYFPPEENEARRLAAAEEDMSALPEGYPDREVGMALVNFAKGKGSEVREILRGVLEKQPYLFEVRHRLAIAELACGDPSQAEAEMNRAVQLGFSDVSAYQTRTYARAALGKYAEAAGDATLVLSRWPGANGIRSLLAILYLRLGRYEESIKEYDRLLADYPKRVDYRIGRSVVRQRTGQMDAAREDADEACRLAPENAHAHLQRGVLLREAAPAIEALSRAIQLDPKLAEAYGRRGSWYELKEMKEEALRDLRKAIELDPKNPLWHAWLAEYYQGAGDSDAAKPEFKLAEAGYTEAIKQIPSDALLYADRGKIRFILGRDAEALADFEKAISLNEGLRPSLKIPMEECRKNLPK